MRRVLLLLAASSLGVPAEAALSERDLARAVARPPAGARLPATVPFTDGRGRRTDLGQVADGRPLVLVFADYTCRHVCSPGLVLTVGALHDTGLAAGRDYRLAVVGFDPRDTAGDARRMSKQVDQAPDIARATSMLTGDAASVAAATRALGYGYVHDRDSDQFAHDAVLYVFAGDGRLSALLPELGLTPVALKAALTGGAPPPESFAARVAHLCYGFAAARGRFGRPIVLGLQLVSALLLALTGVLLLRRRRAA